MRHIVRTSSVGGPQGPSRSSPRSVMRRSTLRARECVDGNRWRKGISQWLARFVQVLLLLRVKRLARHEVDVNMVAVNPGRSGAQARSYRTISGGVLFMTGIFLPFG